MPDLKVVTINILSDLSRWEERAPLLVKGLAALEPDVVALQEVSLSKNNALWLSGKLGLEHVYIKPKTGSSRDEGIAILSRLPFENQAGLDLQSQDRVAQAVQVRVGDQRLWIANGHFYWQPGESPARIRQIELLLEWLEGMSEGIPSVVCGDFNATPDLPSMQKMRERLVSAYAAIHGQEPEYTTPTPLPRSKLKLLLTLFRFIGAIRLSDVRLDWRGTLDYIFVDPRLRVIDCQVVLDKPAPDNPKIYPSDHFGLWAVIRSLE